MKIWLYGPYSMYSTAHILRHLLDRKGEMCHFEFKSRHLQISQIDGLLHQLPHGNLSVAMHAGETNRMLGVMVVSQQWGISLVRPIMPLRCPFGDITSVLDGPRMPADSASAYQNLHGQCISNVPRPKTYTESGRYIYIYPLTHTFDKRWKIFLDFESQH